MRRRFAVLLAAVAGCSNSSVLAPPVSKPEPPVMPAPAPTLVASYVLVLVNGAPRPFGNPMGAGEWDLDYPETKWELESAQLAFYNDGSFVQSWVHRNTANGRIETPQTFKGRYSRISDSILQIGSGDAATMVTLTATGLVWRLHDLALTYELVK